MKILFIKEQRTKTGIEGTGKNLLYRSIELNRLNIPYLVLYNAKDKLYQLMLDNNVNVKYVDFPPQSPRNILDKYNKVLLARKSIKEIVDSENITHIHVHNAYLLDLIGRSWGKTITAHHHSAFNENEAIKYFYLKNIFNPKRCFENFYRKLKVFNYSKAVRCIAVSQGAEETLTETYGVKSSKIDVVYNGITPVHTDEYKNIRNSLGYKDSDILIISVGRITEAKGVEDFCKVAQHFKNHPRYKFIFIGGYNSKEYYKSILKKHENHVNFLGLRSDVFDIYKSSDIVLFLSHREACPNVLIESMNFGLPAICWDVVGVRELIKSDCNGYLCEYLNIPMVCDCLDNLMNDNDLYEKCSRNAYSESQKYTIEKNTNKILEIFERLKR